MLIGILSDSHGCHRPVASAVALFDKLGVEHVIHCGDVCGTNVFEELLTKPLTFVWGNCDSPDQSVLAFLDSVGLCAPSSIPTLLELGGKKIAVYHGHEQGFERAVENLEVDYLFHGHSHIARDERINGKRVINPGALHRAATLTVATMDTATDELKYFEIRDD